MVSLLANGVEALDRCYVIMQSLQTSVVVCLQTGSDCFLSSLFLYTYRHRGSDCLEFDHSRTWSIFIFSGCSSGNDVTSYDLGVS